MLEMERNCPCTMWIYPHFIPSRDPSGPAEKLALFSVRGSRLGLFAFSGATAAKSRVHGFLWVCVKGWRPRETAGCLWNFPLRPTWKQYQLQKRTPSCSSAFDRTETVAAGTLEKRARRCLKGPVRDPFMPLSWGLGRGLM